MQTTLCKYPRRMSRLCAGMRASFHFSLLKIRFEPSFIAYFAVWKHLPSAQPLMLRAARQCQRGRWTWFTGSFTGLPPGWPRRWSTKDFTHLHHISFKTRKSMLLLSGSSDGEDTDPTLRKNRSIWTKPTLLKVKKLLFVKVHEFSLWRKVSKNTFLLGRSIYYSHTDADQCWSSFKMLFSLLGCVFHISLPSFMNSIRVLYVKSKSTKI